MPEGRQKKLNFIVDVLFVAFIIAIAYVVIRVIGLIYPFFIALILVAIFQPLIRFIHRKLKINRKAVSLIIMALLYVCAALLIVWLAVQAVLLLMDLFTSIPDFYSTSISPALQSVVDFVQGLIEDSPDNWAATLSSFESEIMGRLASLVASISQSGVSVITNFVGSAPSFLISLTFTVLLSFFISIQYGTVILFLKNQIGPKNSDIVNSVIKLVKGAIIKYIRAILILMSVTFIELTVGLLILRIDNAIVIAAGIAVFDAFPVLGTGGIMIPWLLISLVQQNFSVALGLTILYAVVTVVRQLIEPKVVGDQLGINPIISLTAIFVGYRLLGLIGMIFFPILAQILLILHQNGTIKLYREHPISEENDKEGDTPPVK